MCSTRGAVCYEADFVVLVEYEKAFSTNLLASTETRVLHTKEPMLGEAKVEFVAVMRTADSVPGGEKLVDLARSSGGSLNKGNRL